MLLLGAPASKSPKLLASQVNIGTVASVQFEGYFTSLYEYFVLYFSRLQFATNDVALQLRGMTAPGVVDSTASRYYYNTVFVHGGGAFDAGGSTADDKMLITRNSGGARHSNATSRLAGGSIEIINPNQSTDYKQFKAEMVYGSTTPSLAVVLGCGGYSSNTALTGVELKPTSGNFSGGNFHLYGVPKQ